MTRFVEGNPGNLVLATMLMSAVCSWCGIVSGANRTVVVERVGTLHYDS